MNCFNFIVLLQRNVNWCPFSNRWGFAGIIDDKTMSLTRELSASSSVLFAVKLTCVATALRQFSNIEGDTEAILLLVWYSNYKVEVNVRQDVNPLKSSGNYTKRVNLS
jgi:hypothetical protein